jgi:hypothetical protein
MHLSMATSTHAAICWQLTHIVRSGLWVSCGLANLFIVRHRLLRA